MLESERAKVLVVGDSGVGKTALVHLICNQAPLLNPSYTVGCSLKVKIHMFRADPVQERPFFMELWDVGGSNAHANTRSIFYQNIHGLMLIYDCTNRKSQLNLNKWLTEVLQSVPYNSHLESGSSGIPSSNSSLARVGSILSYFSSQEDLYSGGGVRLRSLDRDDDSPKPTDPGCGPRLPVLVVGTKVDLLDACSRRRLLKRQDESTGKFCSGISRSATSFTGEQHSLHSASRSPISDVTGQQLHSQSVFVNLNPDNFASRSVHDRHMNFAVDHGFPEILVCCNATTDLSPNSWNAVLLDKFFDDVVLAKLGGLTAGGNSSYSPDALKIRKTSTAAIPTEPAPWLNTLLPTANMSTRVYWST